MIIFGSLNFPLVQIWLTFSFKKIFSSLLLGREFSDFLNSLDDLHEYLRLSYPRLKPPSYFCDNENEYGLILHYRTKRNFLLWYTVGQILKVAKLFYSTDVEVELLSENQEINEYHFILQLHFDNRVYLERLRNGIGEHQHHSNHHGSLSSRCLSRLSINSPLLYTNNFNNNNNNNNNNDSSNSRESPIKIQNYQYCPLSQQQHLILNRNVSPSPSPLSIQSSLSPSPSPSPSPLPPSSSTTTQTQLTQFYSLNNSLEHINLSPITLELFMDIFPFNIVFDSNMKICQIGSCLKVCLFFFVDSNSRNILFDFFIFLSSNFP